MTSYDLSSLRSYVTGGAPRSVPSGTVLLDVEHSLIAQRFAEIPFEREWPISRVKEKIYGLTGTPPAFQRLLLNGAVEMADEGAPLSLYVPPSQAVGAPFIRVVDEDPYALGRGGGGLHDVRQVKKYELSREEYEKRDNTYFAYKKKMREADPNWKPVGQRGRGGGGGGGRGQNNNNAVDLGGEEREEEGEEEVRQRCKVGARCQITPGARRGVIKYVGPIPELSPGPIAMKREKKEKKKEEGEGKEGKEGEEGQQKEEGGAEGEEEGEERPVFQQWIGVQLDEPIGKHDGVVAGKRYFTCPAKCGTFVKPGQIEVGDFKERDPFDEESDEEKEKDKEKDKEKEKEKDSLFDEM